MRAIVLFVAYAYVLSCSVGQAQYFQTKTARCLNPNQRPGTCVSIRDCQTLMTVLQRVPLQPTDKSFVQASQCRGGIGNPPHLCCSSDTGYTRQPPPAPDYNDIFWGSSEGNSVRRERDFGTIQTFRGAATSGNPITTAAATSLLPEPPTCGGVIIENKIYGGNDADLFEFPWMVQLEYSNRSGGTTINCAGSLINKRYVLTAAHCVLGVIHKRVGQLVAIRLGEHDTSRLTDCNQYRCAPEVIRVGIDEIIPYENYKEASSNKAHDIALVRLERDIRFSDNIRPICLPSVVPNSQGRSITQFTVAGWGQTLKGPSSVVKQKLNVPLVGQEQCRRKFRERKIKIEDTHLCAGGKFAEDSCVGDSGGPLMSFRDGAWVLEGIVSFGNKCGLKDWPAVHTRVASFDNWIRSKVRP